MEKLTISSLENLLKFKGANGPNIIVADASILTCGCLVSESYFLSRVKGDSTSNNCNCPVCEAKNVSLLSEITPLRDLFNIIQDINVHLGKSKRRSSSKKSIRPSAIDHNEAPKSAEAMDLISLFYKFAKEENSKPEESRQNSKEDTSSSMVLANPEIPIEVSPIESFSVRPNTNILSSENLHAAQALNDPLNYENELLANLSEEKEYNFSKCFPFHRKLSTFQTQQSKFNISAITKGSIMKKNATFICSDIHTFIDIESNCEITRFVLITNKKWELYEYKIENDNTGSPPPKLALLCCGKLSGEYGKDFNNLQDRHNDDEVVIKNDFASSHNNPASSNTSSIEDKKKKLNNWDQLFCKLSTNYLLIGGTKGIMRVLDVSPSTSPSELGKLIYMYVTNFPIRCIAISPNESLVACGITAKERLSSKEQPFIILHKLNRSSVHKQKFELVEPITITIPYRDPIKIINFNQASTHIICCTVWESRYLIIKLRSKNSDDYKKPRLVWTDFTYARHHRTTGQDNNSESENEDDYHLMDDEGITDLKFGTLSSNVVFMSFCALKNRPSFVIRLDGEIDSRNHGTRFNSHEIPDSRSQVISLLSDSSSNNEIKESKANISGTEIIMKIPAIGSSIHKIALLPRGDGIVYLDKAGHVFLVSAPNFQLHPTSPLKTVVVQLGEVANASRYIEAASIRFSTDGGKIYSVDRKGVFQIFDFTKGIPGTDSDVVKCKIIKI